MFARLFKKCLEHSDRAEDSGTWDSQGGLLLGEKENVDMKISHF